MCGIAGFISPFFNNNFEKAVSSMLNKIEHRGPDDEGIWFDSNYGIALGHRRLSIVDSSKAGHQPMISQCKKYYIVLAK